MWSTRRLSITTTTTFMAPIGAGLRLKLDLPLASSSLSQEAAPSTLKPAAPAPPAFSRSRRERSLAKWLGPALGDVDRPDGVLVWELLENLAHDVVHLALVVA